MTPKPLAPHLEQLRAEINQREQQLSLPLLRASSISPTWHVTQIMSGSERKVAERLRDYGFGCYYPQLRRMRLVPKRFLSHAQRSIAAEVYRPLVETFLPGYMFVEFNMEIDAWHEVFNFVGVRGLWLEGRKVPRVFPSEIIDGWISSEVNGCLPGESTIVEMFKLNIGQEVRINEGAFAGFNGTIAELPEGYEPGGKIEELDSSKRVTLFVSLFGRENQIALPVTQFSRL